MFALHSWPHESVNAGQAEGSPALGNGAYQAPGGQVTEREGGTEGGEQSEAGQEGQQTGGETAYTGYLINFLIVKELYATRWKLKGACSLRLYSKGSKLEVRQRTQEELKTGGHQHTKWRKPM